MLSLSKGQANCLALISPLHSALLWDTSLQTTPLCHDENRNSTTSVRFKYEKKESTI